MADTARLSMLARKFYFEFLALRDGGSRRQFDYKCYRRLTDDLDSINIKLSKSGLRIVELVVEERIRSGRTKVTERDDELLKLQTSALAGLKLFWRGMAADEAMKTHWFKPEPETVNALLAAESPMQVCEICAGAFTYFVYNPATLENEPLNPEDKIAISTWPPARDEWPLPEMDDELTNEMGPTLADALNSHAEQFIAAKKDRRYPKSVSRPTSQAKRLWFVSVALAGAVRGLEVRTAIDALGATRPDEEPQQRRESTFRPKRKNK